jgi:Phycobilisome protein
MARPQLSEKVLNLIQKARIVSFETWQDAYAPEIIKIFQTADDNRLYLSDAELQQLPSAPAIVVALLRDNVTEIVNEARSGVLAAFPDITAPGGALHPVERADACWRDFWQFLRCISYGIAGQRSDYLSPIGLHYMNLLYQELKVPLEAMVVGLEGLKIAALQRVDATQQELLAVYFDRLIEQLKQFY